MRRVIEATVGEHTQAACKVTAAVAPVNRTAADHRRFSKRFSEEWIFRATLRNSLDGSHARRVAAVSIGVVAAGEGEVGPAEGGLVG